MESNCFGYKFKIYIALYKKDKNQNAKLYFIRNELSFLELFGK